MKCDFRTTDGKEVFRSKLSREPIHFGFIHKWERRKFIRFCKDAKVVTPFPNGKSKEVYVAQIEFSYQITWSPSRLVGGLFEWIADWTGFRKRMLAPGLHYAEKTTFTVGQGKSVYGKSFDWIHCTPGLIF